MINITLEEFYNTDKKKNITYNYFYLDNDGRLENITDEIDKYLDLTVMDEIEDINNKNIDIWLGGKF